MADFKRSLAVVIGINEYQHEPKLQTARYDAERLAEILAIEHKYDYVILVADETYKEYRQGQELLVKNKYQPTLDGLKNLLSKRLPAEINPTQEDRLLFYFAGHGIPDDSDEGPKGYLVPLDADSKKRDSLLPMQELYKRLAALNCRHFLVVLDCCFAGRFHWSSTRKGRTFPKVIHKEHYDRFINSPAWQAITSASHDQEAFDSLGDRGTVAGTNHSPFAEGLFKALQGEADVIPAGKNGQPAGDGVITATELYLYLREHVEIGSKERQTPGLWSLPKHERGEYIFLVPGVNPKLKPAPKVNEKNNPYRGLESFDEEHSRFFFGREELIEQLSERISAPKQPLTVVLGVSGSGKSSLVKAGLIPYLKNLSKSGVSQTNAANTVHQWRILNPMRPGESPFTALAKTILALADVTGRNQSDTLNFLNVSTRLDNLSFITEILKQKVNDLDRNLGESSSENGGESAETLRLKKELEKFISIAKGWNQITQKAKQLLIVEHFEELYALCQNPAEQQQLQQVVSDCLNPLSSRLQSDPNQLIDIVMAWSQKNPGVRLLLTIDQFEELITLSQSKQKEQQNNQQQQQKKLSNQSAQEGEQENKQQEWQKFLNLLEKTLSANLEQLRIIVTLRSDFEPRFLNLDVLKSYWTQARFPVRAMRSDELRQAIESPASEMALYFEPPNLVDKLIDEVGQMPGALPLLSFTLSELYIKLAEKWRIQETSDRALRLDADFDKEGGVAGSLTRRANEEYNNLPDDAHRDTLRRVMLRMVTFEGGELARRRVPLSELVYADAVENDRVKLVLERFDRVRLIVSGQETGEPYVEPAHDFLVRSWDKLQKWQQEEQEDLPLQRRLTPAAIEWKSKQEARFLWNADPYLDVLNQVLTSDKDNWFNQIETEFVQKSVWRRRRNTNLRWVIAIAVMVGLLGLTSLALIRQRQALIEQMTADRNSAQTLLRTNQPTIDALISSLQAAKSLKNWLFWGLLQPNKQLQSKVIDTLRTAVYQVKERNHWELPPGLESLSPLNVRQDRVFTQDNKLLLAIPTSDGRNVCVWNSESKQCDQLPESRNHGEVVRVKFSPDGKQLAVGWKDNSVSLWNLGSKQLDGALVDLPGQVMGAVGDISFSPDGSILAVITKYNDERNIAFLWDWKNKKSYPLLANTENVVGISFKPNGNLVTATTKNDGSIELRDWQSGQVSQIPQFIREETLLKGIEFSSEHKRVVIFADNESKITSSLWNWENNKLKELKSDESYPYPPTLSFGSNGKLLATTEDNTVSLYSWYSYRNWDNSYSMGFSTESEFKLPQGRVLSMLLSRDGKQLATQGDDGILRLWDLEEPQPPEADFPQAGVESISFSPDHQTIATTDAEGIVRLWDSAGNKLQEFPIPPSKVTSLSFSPDGKQLATGGADGFVRLWDLKGKQLKQFEAHQGNKLGEVTNVSWSRDGRTIATVIDRVVRLWDVNGNELNSKDYPQLVKSISFQPNGELRVVTTGASDNKFNAFKVFLSNNSGKSTVLISESRDWTYIDFNADGSLIATASRENVVLWDLQGRQLMKFKTHEDEIKSISFSADGSKLAVVGKDGKVKLWQLGGLDELLERGCERVRGHLATLDENNSDRHLCDGISSSTPSVQTTTANSSAPSIVQPSAQNAPSPVPSSNKGQDTPSSSAPANAPGRPQNVPSPTPPSNNGKNNYRQAPSDRRQASKLNSVDAYINQGLTYHRQRNYQQAISSYSKGIALNPKSAIAYSYRASAYVGQKDYQKAIADSSKAISLNPTYVNAYINRGVAYYRQGNSKGAIANYNKAIKLAPGNANAYNNRALAYTRLGNQQAAQADKRKAAALSQRQLR